MKPKTMVLMVVAIGCGLVASYMTSKLIADRGQQAPAEPRIKVLVAKKKIKPLTLMTKPEELFVEKELPIDAVPKKAVKTFEELKDKRLNKPVSEESYVTTDDLVSKDLSGMSASLPPGMRAVALRVNPETLAGGFILPGSRVDVISTTRDGEAVSQIILQDMLVLAVDVNSTHDSDKGNVMLGNTVTLAASPEEAQRMALATSLGELRLLLRPLGDTEKIQVRGSKRGDLSRPISRSASDIAPNPDSTALASASTPKIPELPPVPENVQPVNPMVDMTEPEAPPPPKTHTLTIQTGEFAQKHVFIQEKDGSWKAGAEKKDFEGEEQPRPRPVAPRPVAPRPAPMQGEGPAAKTDGRPLTPVEKLLQGSGQPPVNDR